MFFEIYSCEEWVGTILLISFYFVGKEGGVLVVFFIKHLI